MIEKIGNLWVPSHDAQIEDWREKGSPFLQDRSLKRFLTHCKNKKFMFNSVLDIGAWCGTFSIDMRRYAKKIYCYEPNAINFECLVRNCKKFKNVKCFNYAIGDEIKDVKLTNDSSTQNTRVLLEEGDISMHTVDSLKLNDVDMIKIDVEGLEMKVLEGAIETLAKVKFLMIELNNNSKKYGSSNRKIQKRLFKMGFRGFVKIWPDMIYYNKNVPVFD